MGKVFKKSRHLRWSWEQSPENSELVRYHFIISDDKNKKGKMESILNSIKSKVVVNHPFELIRSKEGKVKGSEFRYLFNSYDTAYSPILFNPREIFEHVKKDPNLYERKIGSIEDYVEKVYSD